MHKTVTLIGQLQISDLLSTILPDETQLAAICQLMNHFSILQLAILMKKLVSVDFAESFLLEKCPPFTPSGTRSIIRLTFNECNNEGIPRAFRSCQENIEECVKKKELGIFPNVVGLAELRISGSGQFCTQKCGPWLGSFLADKVKDTKGKAIVVDLRMEAHGFINEYAVSWFCPGNWERLGQNSEFFENDEHIRLQYISQLSHVPVFKRIEKREETESNGKTLSVDNVMSEKEFVQKIANNGAIEYVRLHVADHCRPFDEDVERFIEVVDRAPRGSWFHIHCKGGAGRTTSFMIIYDMLKNSDRVSFDDILYRHWVIGKADLSDLESRRNSFKFEPAKDRLDFLWDFYQYSLQRRKDRSMGWKRYVRKKRSDK